MKSKSLPQRAIRLAGAGLLASAIGAGVFAQSKSGGQEADRKRDETTLTGCLTRDASGAYALAEEKTGTKSTVTGTSELEKHAANHKVMLTGTKRTDAGGKPVFEATRVQHLAAECKAPPQ